MKEEDPIGEEQFANAHRVAYLIAGHIRKTITPMERLELDEWLEASEDNVALFEDLTNEDKIQEAMEWFGQLDQEKTLQKLKERIPFTPEKKTRRLFWSLAIAACLIMLAGVAAYMIWRQAPANSQGQPIAARPLPVDPLPGGNKALLTLADGSKMVLDSQHNGALAVQGNAQLVKNDSSLSYQSGTYVGISQSPVYNMLETPRGGQYRIVLADGTVVWLNAASSLRYPTAFTGKDREVELRGEGYFEVKHQAGRPFRVKVGGLVLEHLGTSFNVNSYADEGMIKTTLVEGSVRVTSGEASAMLRPGEEAQLSQGNLEVVKADVEAATGWRQGLFVFHGTALPVVMKDLERWYGVNILNKEGNHNHLVATIPRNVPLSKMLYYLGKTGDVRFRWKANDLEVLP